MDPDDREFDDEMDEPLDESERDALQQDLVDVRVLKELLEPRGIRGAVFYCPDCDEDHYLGWDLLAGNLEELLEAGEPPVHEPAFDPDPDHYVSWDYARGFLDGYESFQEEEEDELDETALRLIDELERRDWATPQIKSLLAAIGLDIPPDLDAGAERRRDEEEPEA